MYRYRIFQFVKNLQPRFRAEIHNYKIIKFETAQTSCIVQVRNIVTAPFSENVYKPMSANKCLSATDEETFNILQQDMLVYENFINEAEEKSLFDEVEPYMQRLKYEDSHWDGAIHGYRETERMRWREANRAVIQRVRDLAFPPGVSQLAYVHVLDLAKHGVIKAHIDSVRFCGNTIAGMSLLSNSVMRLVNDQDKSKYGDVLLKQRSLYIMRHRARYEYSHEILGQEESKFRDEHIPRDRRISVICRNEPASS